MAGFMNFLRWLGAKAPQAGPAPRPAVVKRPRYVEPPWMSVAMRYTGTSEIPGPEHNPRVLEMFALAGHGWVKDDETAWCAAFVGAVLNLSNIPGTGSLAARSYEKWGEALDGPVYGCIGVKHRGKPHSWQGHVGFVVGANDREIFMLGGNQSNAVNISAFKRAHFTAFRWPHGHEMKTRPLPTSIGGALSGVTEA